MSRGRLTAPAALGIAAALAGSVGVFSALWPAYAERFDIVAGILPPGVVDAARVLALAFGLGLIWLSRSLARRRRRAWQLSVALVAGLAAAHLAKGLDFEESFFSAAVLYALWRYRSSFTAPGCPASIRPLSQALLALAALGGVALVHAWQHFGDAASVTERAVQLLATALVVRALYLWLRPAVARARHGSAEWERARALVRTYGSDSLAFFALRRDKSYFFSPSGRAFLAYRVVNGTALVSGDPIGDEHELGPLVSEFRRVAQAEGWRVGILGASGARLTLYRSLGFRAVYLGDECVVRPSTFSLEGRAIRKVRQSVNRLEREGFTVRFLGPDEADAALRQELRSVSAAWRGRAPERGFTMAMDAIFAHPEGLVAVAEGRDRRVGGFLHLVPAPASGGYSLAAMRRRPGSPNGLTEYLVVKTIEWARAREVPELSMNFAVFADVLRARPGAALSRRALRFVLLRLDRVFQLERLLSFSAKFDPEWRPRYICVERLSDFPAVGLAYLHAESLLTPPGPWVRSPDLAVR